MLAGYGDQATLYILQQASTTGAREAAKVLREAAPIGVSERLSQYYRRMGLQHGAFKRSVRAAPIRGRGSAITGLQRRTVGSVIGPLGKNAFTRAWIELGTRRGEKANPWVERTAAAAFAVARAASDAVLALYAREH